MKTKRCIALSGMVALLAGCSDSEQFNSLANEPAAPRSEVALVLTDADGLPIEGSVRFTSNDPNREGSGVIVIPEGGVVNIPVSAAALERIEAGEDVSISGTVATDGFLVTPVLVEIDTSDGVAGTTIIPLVATDGVNEISGVEIIRQSGDASAGSITVTVNEDDEGAAQQRGVVTVEQLSSADLGAGDTALSGVDENGNNVALTEADFANLEVEVAHFDALSADALAAFPGGLFASIEAPGSVDYSDDEPAATRNNADEADLANGNEVVFQSAGFVAINVRATRRNSAGQVTQSIDVTDLGPNKIVNVRMDIPAGTQNPETSQLTVAGDTVPVWGINPRDSKWRYEGRATVQQDATGLFVTYQPTHLSYFNLDWFGRGETSRCRPSFTLVEEASGNPFGSNYFITVAAAGYSKSKGPARGNEALRLANTPSYPNGLTVKFGSSYSLGDIEVVDVKRVNSTESVNFTLDSNGAITAFNPCSGNVRSYEVTVKNPPPPPAAASFDIRSTVETFCVQDPAVTAPYEAGYTYAYARTNNTGARFRYLNSIRTDAQGVASYGSRNLVPGSGEVFFAAYDRNALAGERRYYSRRLTAVSGQSEVVGSFRFPRDCPELEVTGSTGTTGSGGSGG